MEKQYETKYPSDVSDEEWAFLAPYLTLCREDAPQREHALRAVFNGLRYIVRTGNQWRFMPGDLPPWTAVYQQTQRWMRAGVFEILVEDVRSLLREFAQLPPGNPARPAGAEGDCWAVEIDFVLVPAEEAGEPVDPGRTA